MVAVLPDGKQIVSVAKVTGDSVYRLFLVPLDGSAPRLIGEIPRGTSLTAVTGGLLAPSPNRKLLAYTSDRRRFLQVCAGSLALAVAACRPGKDRTSLDNTKVTVLYQGDEGLLGPDYDSPPKFLVFLPLVAQNPQGENEGRLAQSWEHSPDYRTWTFHLRRDVRWHDGVPVTAHDVKFSLELMASQPGSGYVTYGMQSVTVLDEFTLTITFKKPLADWTWDVYYPKHLLSNLDPKKFQSWEFWTHPVGNGPYRYLRHVPKTMMELEANPDYYRGKPKIARVVLKFSGSNPLAELLSGNVDVLTDVNRADIPKLASNPSFRVYHGMSGWLDAIYWNHKHPLFSHARVRRALTLAINRRELAQVLNLPEDVPIFDVIFTARQFRRRALPDPLPYDPERAKRLLDEAGWRDQDGDGIRERAGVNAKFTAIVEAGNVLEQAAIYVQAQFRRVGIRMDLQSLESPMVKGKLEDWGRGGEFDAAFSRFYNGTGYVWYFGKQSPINYHNDKLFRLLQAAADNLEPDAQDRIYSEVMEILRDEVPLTFLFPQVETFVAHRRLRGLSSLFRPDPLWFMEYLWLEEER